MASVYVIIGLCVIIAALGYFIVSGTKKNAKLTAENKNITANNNIEKEQLGVAAEQVSVKDAYAGLKDDGDKK